MSTLKESKPAQAVSAEAPFVLRVGSEIGRLQQLIVHTPGAEMELVSPENREHLLFEDILFVGRAREEHLLLCTLVEKIAGTPQTVLQLADLLREALAQEEARHHFVEQLCRTVVPERNLQAYEGELKRLSADELFTFALTGESPLPLILHPLPNLMFTRDVAAVVNDHIILSHPATAARARESAIMNVVLHHHPGFAPVRDRILQLPPGVTFEGGDLLTASPRLLLIGHSERTSFGGITALTQALFERNVVDHVLMVDLPKSRFCMHLDTVFTFTDRDECVVFPPLAAQSTTGNVVRFTRSETPERFYSELRPTLKDALEEQLGRPLTFIPCGGTDPLSQRREQWTDGANFFAIAPGVVVGYERNRRTFEVMREHGYRVVTTEGFLSYYEESDYQPGEKVAIKLEGNELSRGRGGPRCMTLPLDRLPLEAPTDGAAA